MGIANGAGMSVMRAAREVDYGAAGFVAARSLQRGLSTMNGWLADFDSNCDSQNVFITVRTYIRLPRMRVPALGPRAQGSSVK